MLISAHLSSSIVFYWKSEFTLQYDSTKCLVLLSQRAKSISFPFLNSQNYFMNHQL